MQRLDALWSNADDDLPFQSTVNEESILNAILESASHNEIDANLCTRTRQWIKFNRFMNAHEGEPYQTWVEQLYFEIEVLMRSHDHNFLDTTSSNVAHKDYADDMSTGETWSE